MSVLADKRKICRLVFEWETKGGVKQGQLNSLYHVLHLLYTSIFFLLMLKIPIKKSILPFFMI